MSMILSGAIAKREIVASCRNCPMLEVRWIKLQLNHSAWIAMLLSWVVRD